MLMQQRQDKRRPGFTLMEIIAVVTIIMILAGAGVLGFNAVIATQRERRAKIDVDTIQKAVEIYENSNGTAPPSLEVLTQMQANGGGALMPATLLMDPWQQPYIFEPGNRSPMLVPRIYSNGPPGSGRVIANW
jgi:general secretion pathway protein G